MFLPLSGLCRAATSSLLVGGLGGVRGTGGSLGGGFPRGGGLQLAGAGGIVTLTL